MLQFGNHTDAIHYSHGNLNDVIHCCHGDHDDVIHLDLAFNDMQCRERLTGLQPLLLLMSCLQQLHPLFTTYSPRWRVTMQVLVFMAARGRNSWHLLQRTSSSCLVRVRTHWERLLILSSWTRKFSRTRAELCIARW